jgi:hypothetical protein
MSRLFKHAMAPQVWASEAMCMAHFGIAYTQFNLQDNIAIFAIFVLCATQVWLSY